MKTIAIIPARGGSKGIPNKNVMPIAGRPLLAWSILQAKNALVDKIIVSTDSDEYIGMVDSWFPGENLAPFIRPKSLARDSSPTSGVIIDVLDRFPKYDTFVLLEPTAPLRTTANITEPLAYIRDDRCKAVVAVCASHRCHPGISFELGTKDKRLLISDTPSPPRQQLRPVYHLTGTVYAADCEWYREHKTFISSQTMGYPVEAWQDKEIDEPDDIPAILPFMDRIK